MHENPLERAVTRCAEYGGGTDDVWQVDPDKSTVIPGTPGFSDGLVIAGWCHD